MPRHALLLVLLLAPPAHAQVQSRPTDAPLVTAAGEEWYRLREAIQVAGDTYYPAGATVFFDGNTMARAGHYNGVPIYTDTTIEPYSVMLVPVRRGLMQPYERLRRGDLAGTTASRTPSFPVGTATGAATTFQAAASASALPRPVGAVSAYSDEAPPAVRQTRPAISETSVGTAGVPRLAADMPVSGVLQEPPIESLRKPESNDGIWILFGGEKWVSAGAAVPLSPTDFRAIGDYNGFPVFVQRDRADTIFLPTRAGLVAPYANR